MNNLDNADTINIEKIIKDIDNDDDLDVLDGYKEHELDFD